MFRFCSGGIFPDLGQNTGVDLTVQLLRDQEKGIEEPDREVMGAL